MLNIDDRLLKELGESELFLLLHIAKRINKNRTCFPSERLLMKDTGWGREKLSKVKKKLRDSGFIEWRQQVGKDGRKLSNIYKLKTRLISIFVTLTDIGDLNESDIDGEPLPDFPTTVERTTVERAAENQASKHYQSLSINKQISIKENNNNSHSDFPKSNQRPTQEQGELIKDEKDFFVGYEREMQEPTVQMEKPIKPVKTTNVLKLDEIWGAQHAGQIVWLQKAGEEVSVWLQAGAEGICKPNSFEGMDLGEMFVYWVGKEQGRIFQSKSPVQWKTTICNYARVQKAGGGFKSATKSVPYPNAELNEAPNGFAPTTAKLKGKPYLDYADKVKAAYKAGHITHQQATEYLDYQRQD